MESLDRVCPVCNTPMEYRPMQIWTGMRYSTTRHRWACYEDDHKVEYYSNPSEEFKEKEKNGSLWNDA